MYLGGLALQIVFFGNWNAGYLALRKIMESGINISLVVTDYDEEDKDQYRNKVYYLAKSYEIPVFKKYNEILRHIHIGAIGFSVAYGNEIMKTDILDKMKIYNFHPSYLPYYKGASPIQWQIKNRESEWGMSCHIMDIGIDTGKIVSRKKYSIDMEKTYETNWDKYNETFSEFVLENALIIVEKESQGRNIELSDNDDIAEYYKPRLTIPRNLWSEKIDNIAEYLNRNRIIFFAGNRAELGIMFPIILELSKLYYTDLVISDSYETNGKEDLAEKERFILQNNYSINIIKLEIPKEKDIYHESLPSIYTKISKLLERQRYYQYSYAFVLGDRIESFGFALAAFYGKVPLIHIAGGNIANVPYFDTNVRHCLSKMACLHLVFSEESQRILLQLGEEEERICNIGNPTFDYDRLGLLVSEEDIKKGFKINREKCVIFTYHAGPFKNEIENLTEYKQCLMGVMESDAPKIIITYPNHDPGSVGIIRYLDSLKNTERIIVVKSLGTAKLHTLMRYFNTIIVGNSSSGLLETTYYGCPALNIGDRQVDRERAENVTDVEVDKEKIKNEVNRIIQNYADIKRESKKYKTIFGDGKAAMKVKEFIERFENETVENLINKKFIRRNVLD